MTDRLFLEFPSNLRYLRLVSNFGLNAAQTIEKTDDSNQGDFAESLELALNEAVTNSIRHRDPALPEASVIVEIEISRNEMTVRVKDTNFPFDQGQVPAPDLEAHPESGYGIHMMKEIMDQLETRREGDWNILTMSKKFRRSR